MSSFCSKEKRKYAQWVADNKRRVSDTESAFILYHRSDALGACRCDFVFYDKKPIIERRHCA